MLLVEGYALEREEPYKPMPVRVLSGLL